MREQQAIDALKQGDLAGLEYLVSRYQVKAVRAAYLITQDTQTAEDVVADVFLRLCLRIQQFKTGSPFEPYLMRSVVNQALNVARKDARAVPLESDQPFLELSRLLSTPAQGVENQLISKELEEQIKSLLRQLTPRERAAIVQRYYLGSNEKEMAQKMDVAPGTVKWLLHSARERMRVLLGGERIDR